MWFASGRPNFNSRSLRSTAHIYSNVRYRDLSRKGNVAMAIMTEPGNIETAPDQGVIGTSCGEISPQAGKPSGTMQRHSSGGKRLSLEEQRLFFRNTRNFFE
jgi:hypothetical protein